MYKLIVSFVATGLFLTWSLSTASALTCHNYSLYGTIKQVSGTQMLVDRTNGRGTIRIDFHTAVANDQVHLNGLRIEPGVSVHLYGCAPPGRLFAADEVTLTKAVSPSPVPLACEHGHNIFGTIQSVAGDRVVLQRVGGLGETRVDVSEAIRNDEFYPDGLSLKPGVFMGVFGCERSLSDVDAYEITLAPSASAYPTRNVYVETINGIVREVKREMAKGRELLRIEISADQIVEVEAPVAAGGSVGQHVTAVVHPNPDGSFRSTKLVFS